MTGPVDAKVVGEALGLRPRTVYDLVASGRLACHRIGGAVRFDMVDVEAFKKSRRVERVLHKAAGGAVRAGLYTGSLLKDSDEELRKFF